MCIDESSNSNLTIQLAFMQYKFKDEHAITYPPHKNSKGSTLYKWTHPSTIKRMKELGAQCKPSTAFEVVDREMEEETDKSEGKQPRSRSQVSDVRKNLFTSEKSDTLAIMMEQCVFHKEKYSLSTQFKQLLSLYVFFVQMCNYDKCNYAALIKVASVYWA